jgi:hypothetical protein
LDEGNQQFIFKATREILEDLNGLNPDASSSPAARIKKDSPPTTPRVRILGCPVRDEADELALLMCRQLLSPIRYEMEVLPDEALTSEVVDQVAEQSPALICIVSLPPGGLAQTRYLCKRLRARFPDTRIIVGRLGTQSTNHQEALIAAGADKVATNMIELRNQIVQVSQIIPVDRQD